MHRYRVSVQAFFVSKNLFFGEMMNQRKPDYPIADFILNRWSPRAMSGESITDAELNILFEAARWAPSSYNNQPWRFVYAKRETPQWDTIFNLMVDFNKGWAKNAAVLIVVASRNTFEFNNKPARTHSFDTGAACENLALQAHINGLVAHGMEGFDYDAAKKVLQFSEDYTIEAMIAVGKPGAITTLSPELQKREELSDRKKIEEFVFEGTFKKGK